MSKRNHAREELNKHLNKTADIADHSVAGNAALSICESLLIAMRDLKVMSDKDIRNVLEHAEAVHNEASKTSADPKHHKEAAKLIERMIVQNSFPRG